MILAAGRGERLRPITDKMPKPLLTVGGKSLIEYHLSALVRAGIQEVIINYARLGEQFKNTLGHGERYGITIVYSPEGEHPLETGGGILNALPLLGDAAFIVINGDVWTQYPLQQLPNNPKGLAHLVMVDNPPHHPEGDFALNNGMLHNQGTNKFTYSGIGVYCAELFANQTPGAFPLLPLLLNAIQAGQISGEYYSGPWWDIGTSERLRALDKHLKSGKDQ